MSTMEQILYILLLSFYGLIILIFGYTICGADCDDPGLNGRISRYLYEYVPQQISKIISRLAGPNLYKQIVAHYDYAVNERNPIMQGVYLVVLNTSFVCWLVLGAQKLPNSMVGYHHRYLAYVGVAACHYSFYIACKKSPGMIVKANIRCFAHHPYDGALYVEGYGCNTCGVKKVMILLSAEINRIDQE
jgi:hypothetical protein